MKKLFIASAFVLLSFTSLNAQDSKSRFWDGFKVGIKAGSNYSNVYDSKGEEFTADGKFGFVGGAFLEIPITEYDGVRPEVLYSQ